MKNKYWYEKNWCEKGVSEAIGFILIFSLVMIGIGLITLYGYPMLLEQQSNANIKNMERDMIVLQNDIKSLVYKNVPYKETSLQVSGGVLAVYNYSNIPARFLVTLENSDNNNAVSDAGFDENYCGQFRYESDAGEAIIALENGAVLTRMEFQNGSAMLSEPRWFIDENEQTGNNTFIITFINISTDSVMSRNGIGTVKMQMVQADLPFQFTDSDTMKVNIEYKKDSAYDFSKSWENYFINSLEMNKSGSIYYRDDINTLVIKRYVIKIASI